MASDFLDDLSKATALFRQGTQDLALQQALSNANDEVLRIKNTTKDANQMRSDLFAVSQGLTLKLLGVGASPHAVAAASEGILGPQATTAEQATLIGQRTGQQATWDEGQRLLQQQQNQKLEQLDRTGEWQLKNTRLQGQNAFMGARQKEPPPIPPALQEELGKAKVGILNTENMLKKQLGFKGGLQNLAAVPLVGGLIDKIRRVGSPEYVSFKAALMQNYLENQKLMFGATAKDEEVAKLESTLASSTDLPETAKKLLQDQYARWKIKERAVIETQRDLGHNIGAYAQEYGAQPQGRALSSAYTPSSSRKAQQALQPSQGQVIPPQDQAAPFVVDQRSDNLLMQEELASQPLAGSAVRNAVVNLVDRIKTNRKTTSEQKKEQLRQAEEARKARVRKLREGRGIR